MLGSGFMSSQLSAPWVLRTQSSSQRLNSCLRCCWLPDKTASELMNFIKPEEDLRHERERNRARESESEIESVTWLPRCPPPPSSLPLNSCLFTCAQRGVPLTSFFFIHLF